MELQTIGQVSKEYGISTRMLRYYEQIGLIKSMRREGYSYRVYDASALRRLHHIIILRKLQIPVKQICLILNNPSAATAIDIFKKSMRELDNQIAALSTIKAVLNRFIGQLEQITSVRLNADVFDNESVLKLTEALSLVQRNVKESLTMKDLNNADRQLLKLQDVRVIHIPPMTVASSHCLGQNSETRAMKQLEKFVHSSGLLELKPDARQFGFNNSTEKSGIGEPSPGYEVWVSIPDDMAVPAPLVKKKFHGGMYAAHAICAGEFDHWLGLQDWVSESDRYQSDADSERVKPPNAEGAETYLEEQLNFFYNVQNPDFDVNTMQLDLLLPVKLSESLEEDSFEIEGSEALCGFKASLVMRNKFKIMGFSTFISFDLESEEMKTQATQNFWKELTADGRLDTLHKRKRPGAPILMFGSFDRESRQHNAWRQTVCLIDSDITDINSFKAYYPFTKKIGASKWICFEITKETTGLNPYAAASKLGYSFNGPISGVLTVYPDGITGLLDQTSKADRESVIYCWLPVK